MRRFSDLRADERGRRQPGPTHAGALPAGGAVTSGGKRREGEEGEGGQSRRRRRRRMGAAAADRPQQPPSPIAMSESKGERES